MKPRGIRLREVIRGADPASNTHLPAALSERPVARASSIGTSAYGLVLSAGSEVGGAHRPEAEGAAAH
jgi:hypothetical protein